MGGVGIVTLGVGWDKTPTTGVRDLRLPTPVLECSGRTVVDFPVSQT